MSKTQTHTWEWDGGLRPRKQAGNGGHFGLDLAWIYLTSCNEQWTAALREFTDIETWKMQKPDQAISNALLK